MTRLFFVLVVPTLAVRRRNQLVQVETAFLKDVAGPSLPPTHLVVVEAQAPEPILRSNQLVDATVQQLSEKHRLRRFVLPKLLHFF